MSELLRFHYLFLLLLDEIRHWVNATCGCMQDRTGLLLMPALPALPALPMPVSGTFPLGLWARPGGWL